MKSGRAELTRRIAYGLMLLLMTGVAPVRALDEQWGELSLSLQNRASLGAAWRLSERDEDLIGKLNLPGQQSLCAPDDCLSFQNDPAPNQRLVNARGAFLGQVADDGNLNYEQGEIVAAAAKLRSDLKLGWRNFQLHVRGLAFFDAVNDGRDDEHDNTLYQPAETPRPGSVNRQIGSHLELYEAALSGEFNIIGDRLLKVTIGQQTVRWGESTFVPLNTLAEINPPNVNRLYLPGGEINEVFEPVGLALVSADLFANASAEIFYQYDWRPTQPAAAGSFFSDIEIPGGRDFLMIGIGQFPEDPEARHTIAGIPSLISSTTLRGRVLDESYAKPPEAGQFGLRLNYFADFLNGGTEISLYAMNYHSRLPYLSVIAAQESCARNSTDLVDATLDCRGFNGSLNPTGTGLEPASIDTLTAFRDYPSDIHMYGISFNTPFFGWSLAGEYAYRPNLPAQISAVDVVFAGLQPALPRQDIVIGVPGVLELATLPGSRRFVPDFLSVYRGIDIQGGERVPGYERLKVGQVDFTAIRILSSSNPLAADQIQLIVEAGATHVIDMPDRERLQFEGGVWHKDTHASPGADGSGGSDDPLRLNPTQQTGYFADAFAWGYRLFARLEYNNVLPGINLIPTFGFFHDVSGIGIHPMQNFVEGRLQYMVGSEFVYRSVSALLLYHAFEGSNNTLRDRDYLSFALAYGF